MASLCSIPDWACLLFLLLLFSHLLYSSDLVQYSSRLSHVEMYSLVGFIPTIMWTADTDQRQQPRRKRTLFVKRKSFSPVLVFLCCLLLCLCNKLFNAVNEGFVSQQRTSNVVQGHAQIFFLTGYPKSADVEHRKTR